MHMDMDMDMDMRWCMCILGVLESTVGSGGERLLQLLQHLLGY